MLSDLDENGWVDPTAGGGEVVQVDHYYPFGMRMSGTSPALATAAVPNAYSYNGKELQDELNLGWHDYGARMYDASVGRWNGVDALAEEYYSQSSYHFSGNNPIRFVDPNGMNYGDYYTRSGRYLGTDGEEDNKVYAVDDDAVLSAPEGSEENLLLVSGIEKLEITHTEFLGFASLIYHESSGDFEESHAIANATMNFLAEGGSNQINTLEDVVLYENNFAYGAKQDFYSDYIKDDLRSKNDRFEISAVINGLTDGPDYSVGANTWDGIDLVSTKRDNPHRNYVWNSASKQIVSQYKQHVNGGINVGGWTYSKKEFQISATRMAGKSLFTRLLGAQGQGRSNTRIK